MEDEVEASQVAARYSLVAGSELRENSAVAECSTPAIGQLGLTSIEMLNVPRRWNKEPVLFSHLLALRGMPPRIEAAIKLLSSPRMGEYMRDKARRGETCGLCILILSKQNFLQFKRDQNISSYIPFSSGLFFSINPLPP